MKKKINEYVDHYIHKHIGNEEKIHEFSMFVENFFCNMDEEYFDVKEAFFEELEDFTEEIDEVMATSIVENFKKKDGSHSGMKWTHDETDSVCKQYDVRAKIEHHGKQYDPLKFWVAMNYVYATHFSTNRSTLGYVELAVDEMTNKNMCFDYLLKHIYKKI